MLSQLLHFSAWLDSFFLLFTVQQQIKTFQSVRELRLKLYESYYWWAHFPWMHEKIPGVPKTPVSEVIRFSLTCNRFFSGTPFTYLHIKYYISCSKNPMMVTHKDWLEFSKVRNLKSKVMRRIFINVHLRISSAPDRLKKMNTNSALEAFSFHAVCIFC